LDINYQFHQCCFPTLKSAYKRFAQSISHKTTSEVFIWGCELRRFEKMKNLVLVFLVPLISCRALLFDGDEPVATVEPTEEIELVPEDKFHPRAMPELLKNFRGTIDWSDLSKTVQKCADEAMNKRQEYFGIQYYGECWGGEEADLSYDQYGSNPAGCYNNMVGKAWHNFVYKFNIPGGDSEE
ncbi:hypothetical protein pdam_00010486, partial [Pocillopora damicornis]